MSFVGLTRVATLRLGEMNFSITCPQSQSLAIADRPLRPRDFIDQWAIWGKPELSRCRNLLRDDLLSCTSVFQ